MIQLTRLNNQPLMVNPDLIKFIENAPDTVLTLVTGEKVVVLETTAELLQRIIEFRRRLMEGLVLNNNIAPPAPSISEAAPGDEDSA